MSEEPKRRTINRRRDVDRSEEGVATTVGTIMALLVFLSLLSLVVQQYIPVWIEDNEAYHMADVQSQFADMKSGIDNLILTEQRGYPRYNSINLGTEGIPLFADSTPGVLRHSSGFGEDGEGMHISWTVDVGEGEEETIVHESSGNISLEAQNRYFERQTVVYEHGAILLDQAEGGVMRARPHITIEGGVVRLTMISLEGSNPPVGGAGTVGLTVELASMDRDSVEDPDNFNFELTTAYPEIWEDYFVNQTDLLDDGNIYRNGSKLTIDYDVEELEITRARFVVDIDT